MPRFLLWFGLAASALMLTLPAEAQNPSDSPKSLYFIQKVFVVQFKFTGNTVFSGQELNAAIAGYQNRAITLDELQEIKSILTNLYVNRGYINSGVRIPDQKVQNQEITLQIIEGRLSGIHISGNKHLKTAYIADRLSLATEDGKLPLNMFRLQEQLRILKTDPRIEVINGHIKPGLVPGEASMDVMVEEARPYKLGVGADNHNSPSVGAFKTSLTFEHLNLSGRGDTLNAEGDLLSEGYSRYAAAYSYPLTRKDARLGLRWDRSYSELIDKPFRELEIESETDGYQLYLQYPLLKSPQKDLGLGLALSSTHNRVYFAGDPIDLFPGAEDGKVRLTVWRFWQEGTLRRGPFIFSARSTVNWGANQLGATAASEEPNGEFVSWLGEFRQLWRLPWLKSQLMNSVDVQISGESLLPFEKFAIGGPTSVRGYRAGEASGDSGLYANIEWRLPVGSWNVPVLPQALSVTVMPFLDFGRTWDQDSAVSDPVQLYSAGLDLRCIVGESLVADFCYGQALKEVDDYAEYDLQDDGLYVKISASF